MQTLVNLQLSLSFLHYFFFCNFFVHSPFALASQLSPTTFWNFAFIFEQRIFLLRQEIKTTTAHRFIFWLEFVNVRIKVITKKKKREKKKCLYQLLTWPGKRVLARVIACIGKICNNDLHFIYRIILMYTKYFVFVFLSLLQQRFEWRRKPTCLRQM